MIEVSFVLDSWPILEWLQGKQSAAARFSEFLERAVASNAKLLISRMNYGEIVYMLPKKLSAATSASAKTALRLLPLEIVSVDDRYVDEAVAIKADNNCSFADCFAAALAIRVHAPVVTGDRECSKRD